MNRINKLFNENKNRKLLSLYFCAGCPTLEGTGNVILTLQERGIDMIEVGIPFSDPLADGPVIQSAGTVALKNGITLRLLFQQLKEIKGNSVLQVKYKEELSQEVIKVIDSLKDKIIASRLTLIRDVKESSEDMSTELRTESYLNQF